MEHRSTIEDIFIEDIFIEHIFHAIRPGGRGGTHATVAGAGVAGIGDGSAGPALSPAGRQIANLMAARPRSPAVPAPWVGSPRVSVIPRLFGGGSSPGGLATHAPSAPAATHMALPAVVVPVAKPGSAPPRAISNTRPIDEETFWPRLFGGHSSSVPLAVTIDTLSDIFRAPGAIHDTSRPPFGADKTHGASGAAVNPNATDMQPFADRSLHTMNAVPEMISIRPPVAKDIPQAAKPEVSPAMPDAPASGMGVTSAGGAIASWLSQVGRQIANFQTTVQRQVASREANTEAFGSDAPAAAGRPAASTGGNGASPTISGVASLFGNSAPPPVYAPPAAGLERSANRFGPDVASDGGGTAAARVTVNVTTMDAQSFMDWSANLTNIVREAMLNLHPAKNVILNL